MSTYKLINRRTKDVEAEAVTVGSTLHVHYYNSRGSFQYEFGKWPSIEKYIYKYVESKVPPMPEKKPKARRRKR